MCRYGMTTYKSHYACFDCKKTFKRRLMWDINRDDKRSVEAKCPQCGQLMANMGLDFASPKKDNTKEWTHIKNLYSVGITFHSCGCSGPGYIPNSKEKLIEYFEKIKQEYHSTLDFWRQRTEPKNDRELQSEKSKSWKYLSQMPNEITPKKGAISNEDAKKYWFDKIKQVDQKLAKIK
ncbi:MAG: hypothetical protein EOO47_14885 [Flavobacterium sp.]|nr:MAG: hypothetical protein EOO47_14885 [Flavobacterium sp.]